MFKSIIEEKTMKKFVLMISNEETKWPHSFLDQFLLQKINPFLLQKYFFFSLFHKENLFDIKGSFLSEATESFYCTCKKI